MLELSVLGPLQVRGRSGLIEIPGTRRRVLLALLCLSANEVVSVDRLIEELWRGEPPRQAVKALQMQISLVRRALADGSTEDDSVLVKEPGGYQLVVDPAALDTERFGRLVDEARAAALGGPDAEADPARAVDRFGAALALWRGPAFAELADTPSAQPEIARLDELRLTTIEDREDARLALGDHHRVAADLEGFVQEHPERERAWGQLMVALYRSGRQVDALRCYERARAVLAESGLSPSPPLRHLEQLVLDQSPSLSGPSLTGQSPNPAGLRGPNALSGPAPDDDRLVSDGTVSGRGSRTTTFLFTDLEGSTEQWERAPALMAQALAAHDALVRDVVEEHGGEVFSASGDGFAASFRAAPDALAAAVDIQRRLGPTGAEDVELRMRIGLHTGAAQARSGNYFGRAVNRAARIMAAGNGGQIVLSAVTAGLVAGDPAYELVPLGSHLLPGLAEPVALVGVATADLPWIDRPVRAGGGKPGATHGRGALTVDDRGVRATLRGTTGTPFTTFVGRDAELREVTRLLGTHRLVTLVGAGGCGKTRLALIAARAMATATPGGAVFVDLAPVADGPAVPAAVAAALDLSVGDDRAVDDLCDQLAGVAALLVLDNCEHVIDHVAVLVEQLLARDGSLRILATSREPLRVPAEMVWPVPPLAVPELTDGPDVVRAAEAVRLFVDRAGAGASAAPGPGASRPAELAAVARICRRLDGLPLAIELAAALVSSMPVEDIADRLDHRFELLTAGARSVPRHRTLAAAIQWSIDLLSDDERALFSALGVFVGPFPLAAVEAVIDDHSGHSAALLAELVAKSMVTVVRVGHSARTSYRLLESLRAYALDQLQRRPDAAELHRRHADFYAACAEEAERHVHGREAGEWLGRVLDELPNMREALATSFSSGDLRTGLRLAGSLGWYFGRLGRIGEAAEWLDLALDADEDLSPQLQLLARRAAGTIAFTRGDYTRTSRLGQEGIALARQLGDRRELSIMLIVRGGAAVYEGAFDQAQACFSEADALCRDLGDRWGRAWLLTLWSVVYRHQGDLRMAGDQLAEALATFQEVGDEHGQVLPLVNLSINALLAGNADEAAIQAQSALDLARQLGDRQYEHVARTARGRTELYRGDLDTARQLLLSSLGDFPGYEHWLIVAWASSVLAQIAARRGHHEEACVLEGYSDRVRDEHGIAPAWHAALDLPDWFSSERADAARTRGAELTLPEVVSCAAAATATAGLMMEGTG